MGAAAPTAGFHQAPFKPVAESQVPSLPCRRTGGENAIGKETMQFQGILFDLFHTLVNVASAPGASGRYTADILGIERSVWRTACFGDLHDICRPTDHREVIRRLAHSIDPGIADSRIEEAAADRQRRFDHALTHVDPETLDALAALRQRGLKLALVSNASTGEVSAWRDSPLSKLFDAAVFSCECGWRKPEPEIYRWALERIETEAGQALFVGDGGSDEHTGARRVGLTAVLITRFLSGEAAAQRRSAADCEVSGLEQLGTLLRPADEGENVCH
jgi:putative hydrolase of the HAD superfamily